jgi:hypothetical protein
MKLVVAAPVAERAWALPSWYARLAKQSVRPDQIFLLHGGYKGDQTWQVIEACAKEHHLQTLRWHEGSPPMARHNNDRFALLARLRNQMLAWAAIASDANYLLSLDTDIMLDDRHLIAKLLHTVQNRGCDTASPYMQMIPGSEWCVNAGNFPLDPTKVDPGNELLYQWPWDRAQANFNLDLQQIQIPMAVTLMKRHIFERVRYRNHEKGEDIGFGISLAYAKARCGWLPRVAVRHVWQPAELECA